MTEEEEAKQTDEETGSSEEAAQTSAVRELDTETDQSSRSEQGRLKVPLTFGVHQ